MAELIIVDIQPEYLLPKHFESSPLPEDSGFINRKFLRKFISFLEKNSGNYSKIHYLYNGQNTCDMISETKLISWLLDQDLESELISRIKFYDKGYAYFRACIDDSLAKMKIVELVKYMYKKRIHDTRDLKPEFWLNWDPETRESFFGTKDINDQTYEQEPLYIPDLMEYLDKHISEPADLIGGVETACLYEVEIALLALDKDYHKLPELIY